MPGENFWLTLQCELGNDAPEGPGWYVYAARPDAALIPIRRVTREQALQISEAIEHIFDEDAQRPPVLPSQLHESGNTLIRKAIDEQVAEAEKVALKLARLRKLQAAEKEQEQEQ